MPNWSKECWPLTDTAVLILLAALVALWWPDFFQTLLPNDSPASDQPVVPQGLDVPPTNRDHLRRGNGWEPRDNKGDLWTGGR